PLWIAPRTNQRRRGWGDWCSRENEEKADKTDEEGKAQQCRQRFKGPENVQRDPNPRVSYPTCRGHCRGRSPKISHRCYATRPLTARKVPLQQERRNVSVYGRETELAIVKASVKVDPANFTDENHAHDMSY